MGFDQNKYTNEFKKEHYDRITVLVPKGTKARWKAAAQRRGKSLSAYVFDLVKKDIQTHFPDLNNPESKS